MDSFVKLSQVFLINLKPNEDIDYASEPFLPMSPMDALRTGNYAKDVQVISCKIDKKYLLQQLYFQILSNKLLYKRI